MKTTGISEIGWEYSSRDFRDPGGFFIFPQVL